MDTVLLFRKRSPLTDDRLPWLRGSEEHSWPARRNTSGKGVVSAILVRVLPCALKCSLLIKRNAEDALLAPPSFSPTGVDRQVRFLRRGL